MEAEGSNVERVEADKLENCLESSGDVACAGRHPLSDNYLAIEGKAMRQRDKLMMWRLFAVVRS
jgi:hypothetical protein